jgi:hypothetical protein
MYREKAIIEANKLSSLGRTVTNKVFGLKIVRRKA